MQLTKNQAITLDRGYEATTSDGSYTMSAPNRSNPRKLMIETSKGIALARHKIFGHAVS